MCSGDPPAHEFSQETFLSARWGKEVRSLAGGRHAGKPSPSPRRRKRGKVTAYGDGRDAKNLGERGRVKLRSRGHCWFQAITQLLRFAGKAFDQLEPIAFFVGGHILAYVVEPILEQAVDACGYLAGRGHHGLASA
jgi:hypothetical protein